MLVIIILGILNIILNYLGKRPIRNTNNYPIFFWNNFLFISKESRGSKQATDFWQIDVSFKYSS